VQAAFSFLAEFIIPIGKQLVHKRFKSGELLGGKAEHHLLNGRLLFGQPHGFEISADILNTQYMDKTVYFYADAYEQVVKIYAMREE